MAAGPLAPLPSMTEDRAALIRLLDHLEATTPPPGFIAHLRHRLKIKECGGVLEWDDIRAEGRRAFFWSPLTTGLLLLYAGAVIGALPRWIGHLGPLQVALRIALLSAMALLSILVQLRLVWRGAEKSYADWLARARQLPLAPDPAERPGLP